MASIERIPLPPLGSGPLKKLGPADRDDLIQRAREVIDDYMFGAGSWQTDGPRKSEWQTTDDLSNFKREIAAREQFVDDPGSILASIKDMVDAAIKQINDSVTMREGRDRNQITPMPPKDPIELPFLKTSPKKMPIMAPSLDDRSASSPPGNVQYSRPGVEDANSAYSTSPARYLRGRLVDRSGRIVLETGAPAVPFLPSGSLAPKVPSLNQPPPLSSSGPAVAGPQYGDNNARPAGGNGSGQAPPAYPLPPVLGGADPSAPSDADMSDWYTRWVKSLQQN